jgi:glycosyltransferase involved in cell wall biosynthesis
MRVVYLLSASGNPLYGGQYELNSRYQTYGQHSFIYDLVRAAARRGILVDLLIDGRDTFPLTVPLASSCDVHDFATAPSLALADADFALVDEIPEHLLNVLPDHVRAFCIVHNAAADYSGAMKRRCTKFLCMTETAFRYQSRSIPIEQLVLIRQGVDLERFLPKPRSSGPSPDPRVLVYSRMDQEKETTKRSVIEQLVQTGVEVTVLGAGEAFWRISDEFGDQVTLINHIPCHSIHRFLTDFDVIVSSGRGAMEALASGIPTLCAGFEYAGLITPENIQTLLETNLTGYGFGIPVSAIAEDVARAMLVSPTVCRRLAEEHLAVDRYLDQLLALFSNTACQTSRRVEDQRAR